MTINRICSVFVRLTDSQVEGRQSSIYYTIRNKHHILNSNSLPILLFESAPSKYFIAKTQQTRLNSARLPGMNGNSGNNTVSTAVYDSVISHKAPPSGRVVNSTRTNDTRHVT